MPLYDYECQECGYKFEATSTMEKRLTSKCPKCFKDAPQIITGSRLDIFKPFWSEHIADKPVYIESKDHWAHLCRNGKDGPLKNPIVHGGYKEYGKQKREI